MKAVTASVMTYIDRCSIEEYGVPEILLMGNAGRAIADTVASYFSSGSVAVFCGTGNNGGDGFAAAYYLSLDGYSVTCYFAGSRERCSHSTATFFTMCERTGIAVESPDVADIASFDIVIDALLGTGLVDAPREPVARYIAMINSHSFIVAADIPSGMPAQGAIAHVAVVKATATVTMGLPKLSMVTWPGVQYTGKLIKADIGFPKQLLEEAEGVHLLDGKSAGAMIPRDRDDFHKGDRGRLLIIGGRFSMEGALLLAARGALGMGVGLLYGMTDSASRSCTAGLVPEMMMTHWEGVGALRAFLEEQKIRTVVVGPGLDRDGLAREIFSSVIDLLDKGVLESSIVDGDALFFLPQMVAKPWTSPASLILTPHLGEGGRLLDVDSSILALDPLASAKRIADRYGASVLLKGPRSVICDGDEFMINTTGNHLLATGGSGDVLAGMVGALCARGVRPAAALGAAAWFHGRAADLILERGAQVLKAGDIPPMLPGITRG